MPKSMEVGWSAVYPPALIRLLNRRKERHTGASSATTLIMK
jgi:hypothetical protein